jgi:hypothetical protein
MTQAGAIRFWEWRRLQYDVVLAAVFLFWVAVTWPVFRPALHLVPLAQLFVLALIANVCYSAAYLAELVSHNLRWRQTVWVVGTVFAVLLETYWIGDEILPTLR